MKQKRFSLVFGLIFCLLGIALLPIGIVQVIGGSLGLGITLIVLGIVFFLLSPILLLIYGLIDRDCAREYDRRNRK